MSQNSDTINTLVLENSNDSGCSGFGEELKGIDSEMESPICGRDNSLGESDTESKFEEDDSSESKSQCNTESPGLSPVAKWDASEVIKVSNKYSGNLHKRSTSTQPSPGSFSDVARYDKYRRVKHGQHGYTNKDVNDKRRKQGVRREITLDKDGPLNFRSAKSLKHVVEQTPVAMSYKSNVQSVVKDLQSIKFTNEHLAAIKKTPFWHFFNALLKVSKKTDYKRFRKCDRNIASIIKRYHVVDGDRGFLFGNVFLTPVREDVELIFGVKDGRIPIVVGSGTAATTGNIKRCFPVKAALHGEKNVARYRLIPSLCRNALLTKVTQGDKDFAHDVARLLHLYLLSTFFVPNQNGSLNWRITEIIDD